MSPKFTPVPPCPMLTSEPSVTHVLFNKDGELCRAKDPVDGEEVINHLIEGHPVVAKYIP